MPPGRLGEVILVAQAKYAASAPFPAFSIYHLLGDPAL